MSDIDEAQQALQEARSIAVIGFSRQPGKAAHDIPVLMKRYGYDVMGINPGAVPEAGGISVVASVEDVRGPIDILNVFRPSDETDAIIDAALERRKVIGDVKCIWLQLGIISRNGRMKCAQAGVRYVDDTCIYVVKAGM